jgi:hypothetical protein
MARLLQEQGADSNGKHPIRGGGTALQFATFVEIAPLLLNC